MKRFIVIIIALAILAGIAPLAVFADGGKPVEASFNITYDPSMVITTTRLTGREVSKMLKHAVTSIKGTGYYGDDQGWYVYANLYDDISEYTTLGYFEDDIFRNLFNSDEYLTSDKEYYYEINVENTGGYIWDVDNLPTVTVNGSPADVRWRNRDETGDIDVYVKAPLNETGHAVADVKVKPDHAIVQRGTQKQFSLETLGTSSAAEWTVIGAESASTRVSSGGLLTVAANETASFILVKASSAYSPAWAQSQVTLIDELVRIEDVTLDVSDAVVPRGGALDIKATVTGTDVLDLEWSLDGDGMDSGTELTFSGTSARLYVSSNEDEKVLTVTARSVADPTKFAVARITVGPGVPIPSSINVEYNAAQVALTTATTGREATQALRDSLISVHGTGSYLPGETWYVYCNAYAGDGTYTCVGFFDEYDDFVTLNDSDEPLSADVQYYLWFNIEDCSGCEWDVDNLPTVTINGAEADIIRWRTQDRNGDIDVFIKVSVGPPSFVKGDLDKDGEITVADALAALRIAAKLAPETAASVEIGDTDGDGHVTVSDALAILRVAAKLASPGSLQK